MFYCKPDVTFKIISTRWGLFTCLAGAIYSYHLLFTISGVDKFTDYMRLNPCGEPGSELSGEEASAILDGALLAVVLFHMIEWIRWTIFLTSALVNVNLIPVFYVLSVINIPYGFIAMLVGISKRYSDGDDCAENQPDRVGYLGLQVICILIFIITFAAHILLFKVKGVEWCHEQYLAEDDDDDD